MLLCVSCQFTSKVSGDLKNKLSRNAGRIFDCSTAAVARDEEGKSLWKSHVNVWRVYDVFSDITSRMCVQCSMQITYISEYEECVCFSKCEFYDFAHIISFSVPTLMASKAVKEGKSENLLINRLWYEKIQHRFPFESCFATFLNRK